MSDDQCVAFLHHAATTPSQPRTCRNAGKVFFCHVCSNKRHLLEATSVYILRLELSPTRAYHLAVTRSGCMPHLEIAVFGCQGINVVLEQDVIFRHIAKQQRHLGLVVGSAQDFLSNLQHGRDPCAACHLHAPSTWTQNDEMVLQSATNAATINSKYDLRLLCHVAQKRVCDELAIAIGAMKCVPPNYASVARSRCRPSPCQWPSSYLAHT